MGEEAPLPGGDEQRRGLRRTRPRPDGVRAALPGRRCPQHNPVAAGTCRPPRTPRAAHQREVRAIRWGGTELDPDSRHLYRTEIFPETVMCGNYGSTMILGMAGERPGLDDDSPCVFDSLSPWVTFSVVDTTDSRPVPRGERGQVLVHHVSKSFLLPNNLERDSALRMDPPQEAQATRSPTSAPRDLRERGRRRRRLLTSPHPRRRS